MTAGSYADGRDGFPESGLVDFFSKVGRLFPRVAVAFFPSKWRLGRAVAVDGVQNPSHRWWWEKNGREKSYQGRVF